MSELDLPAEDWAVVSRLLDAALDLSPEERQRWLDSLAPEHLRLRPTLETLLRAHGGAQEAGFLESLPSVAPIERLPAKATGAGVEVGPYRLERELGRGGMSTVWLAHRTDGTLKRPVALKLPRSGLLDGRLGERLARERDILASLAHAHIARLYDAGVTAGGQPYLALEHIEGEPLTSFCDRKRLSVRQRIELFSQVLDAVQYAHGNLVVHRDLKPSNILVDAQGTVKLLDFGIAKLLEEEGGAARETELTELSGRALTLDFASPEQIRGLPITTASDVYSLGVILYLLLTGQRPYRLKRGSRAEIEEAILTADSPPPSRAATSPEDAAARSATERKLSKELSGDLDWIVLKAVAKEPSARYGSPRELASDLERHLANEPVLAGPPSAAYRIGKFVRRHTAGVATATAVLVLLVATAVGVTLQARRIARERDRADQEAKTSGAALQFLTDLFKVSDPSEARGNAVTAREILDKGAATIERKLAGEPAVQAKLLGTIGKVYRNLGLFEQAEPIQERALEMQRRVLGEENFQTIATMEDLAYLYVQEGRYADAERLYARAIELDRRLLGEDDPDILSLKRDLMGVYHAQARFDEAEALSRQIVSGHRRTLGDDHAHTIASINTLAAVVTGRRRYPEAERLYDEVIERARRALGEDHPDTLSYMANLAITYEREGRFPEAEKLIRDVVERRRRVLGDDHPATLESLNTLASVLDEGGRTAEAEAIDREVLDRRRLILGEDHRDTLTSMNNLANKLSVRGRYDEAEAMLRKVLEGDRRLLGERHPDTTNTLYNLACVASLRGDRARALDWLGQAVERGYSHWDVMQRDSDLKPLRGDARFEALVAQAKKNPPKE